MITTVLSQTSLDSMAELAAQLRVDSIRASTSAGSGHPTPSMSAADLVAVLVSKHLRYDNDRTAPCRRQMTMSISQWAIPRSKIGVHAAQGRRAGTWFTMAWNVKSGRRHLCRLSAVC